MNGDTGLPAHRDAQRCWLQTQRDALLAPAQALQELSSLLLQKAAGANRAQLACDQQQICASARRLVEMIQGAFDPAAPANTDELARRIRHDLRTPLAEMIGLCELWLEDGAADLDTVVGGNLQQVYALSRKLLATLDELVGQGKSVPDAENQRTPNASAARQAITAADKPASEGIPPPGDSLAGAILVVDDNPTNRDLLTRRLEREGHTITAVDNGREALARARAQAYDLILLDIIMPGMNGVEVLAQLKGDARLRHIPVIMISALHELESVVLCIEMGAEDYLPKPFDPVLLRARIGACLEKKRLRDREVQYLEQIEREQRRADELLHVILPGSIVKELKTTNTVQPRRFENVAVLFADIVGFTSFCDENPPEDVVPNLQRLMERAEEIAVTHGVQKIKTIGDAFMAAAGLLEPAENPVLSCLRCALDLHAACGILPTRWEMRIGVHVGAVIAGVIGRRQYLFDLWGDTVNTAARMKSFGLPGSVVLSATAWQHIAHCCHGTSCGPVAVKGKGEMEIVRFDRFT
jgi:CheY-like chemotaxis protein